MAETAERTLDEIRLYQESLNYYCCVCHEPIEEDYWYSIDGQRFCVYCMDSFKRKRGETNEEREYARRNIRR